MDEKTYFEKEEKLLKEIFTVLENENMSIAQMVLIRALAMMADENKDKNGIYELYIEFLNALKDIKR